jgi:hypothetical protein
VHDRAGDEREQRDERERERRRRLPMVIRVPSRIGEVSLRGAGRSTAGAGSGRIAEQPSGANRARLRNTALRFTPCDTRHH